MRFAIEVNDREWLARIEAMPPKVRLAIERWALASGLDLEAFVKSGPLSGGMLKVRTGVGRASINTQVTSDSNSVTATVGTNVGYMIIQHQGVGHPWLIEARNAKALRFQVGGQIMFRRRVTHPPLAPHPFLTEPLQQRWPTYEGNLRAEIAEAIA